MTASTRTPMTRRMPTMPMTRIGRVAVQEER